MGYVAELLFQRRHDFDDGTMAKIFPTSDQNSTYAFVKFKFRKLRLSGGNMYREKLFRAMTKTT